jgi:hypothetical protein
MHWATSRKVAGSIPDGVIDINLQHYGLEFDTACNRNEYQDYFLGGKGSRCIRLATAMLVILKFVILKLMGLSGLVQGFLYLYLPVHVSR